MLKHALTKLAHFRHRYEKQEMVVFFIGGFCFDLLLLERIDSVPMLIHQGSYLVLLSILLAVDQRYAMRAPPGGWLGKVLSFRTWVIHFLLGTLLNAFLVFYFKAASSPWAFVFLVALGGLLIANELPRFRELGPIMRVALLSFAWASYLSYLLPVLFGFLSASLFVLAVGMASALTYFLWRLYRFWTPDARWTFTRAVLPGLSIQAALLALYFLRVIPPVPLSLRWIGIYHDVTKGPAGQYELTQDTPWWEVWAHGDTTFKAKPGDRVYLFTRIFAPRRFNDGLQIRWALREGNHWAKTDAIPITISGGNDLGWHGVSYKEHWQPGLWRVTVETVDGREVGSLRFRIVERADDEPPPQWVVER